MTPIATTLKAPPSVLAQQAVRATLNLYAWGGRKSEKQVNAEVAANHNSRKNMGNYTKKLLTEGSPLDEIETLDGQIRAWFLKNTLPWDDNSNRVCPSHRLLVIRAAFNEFKDKRETLVEKLISEFDYWQGEAERQLGTLYKASDYPKSIANLRKRFTCRLTLEAISTADHFVVKMTEDQLEKERSIINETFHERVQNSVRDPIKRLMKPVTHMIKRLELFEVTEEGIKNGFKDTLVTNIQDIVNMIPDLNWTNDPELDAFAKRVNASLCKYNGETLRANEDSREEILESAQSILDQINAYLA